jgi:predicted permease
VLRGGRAASARSRAREALLIAQVALSVVLLVGAGLFVRSFAALQRTELGFDAADLVLLEIDLPRPRYPNTAQHVTFYERVIDRVRSLPGVVSAAGTNEPPGGRYEMTFSFGIEGRPAQNASGREDPEQLRTITPGYFDVLGQRVVHGRVFDERDRADGVPVAIVNEALARKHWPDRHPIGERIAFQPGESPWLEIVGVVGDVRLASPDRTPVPAIYIPHAQKTWTWLSWLTVLARVPAGTDAAAVKADLRSALLELDADLPPQSLGTATEAFRENLARRSFARTLVTGFGAVALLLSVVGLYGLLAYMVAQQQREIGVRLAIGAHAGTIVRSVLARSLALTSIGAAGGLVIAAGATRAVETLLYGVSRLDPATYGITVMVVVAVALATAVLPAWKAAHVSPLQAIRSD